MSLIEFIIIHNQASFIRVEKSLSLGRIGATNRRVKFTWSTGQKNLVERV